MILIIFVNAFQCDTNCETSAEDLENTNDKTAHILGHLFTNANAKSVRTIIYKYVTTLRDETLNVGREWLQKNNKTLDEYADYIKHPGNNIDELGIMLYSRAVKCHICIVFEDETYWFTNASRDINDCNIFLLYRGNNGFDQIQRVTENKCRRVDQNVVGDKLTVHNLPKVDNSDEENIVSNSDLKKKEEKPIRGMIMTRAATRIAAENSEQKGIASTCVNGNVRGKRFEKKKGDRKRTQRVACTGVITRSMKRLIDEGKPKRQKIVENGMKDKRECKYRRSEQCTDIFFSKCDGRNRQAKGKNGIEDVACCAGDGILDIELKKEEDKGNEDMEKEHNFVIGTIEIKSENGENNSREMDQNEGKYLEKGNMDREKNNLNYYNRGHVEIHPDVELEDNTFEICGDKEIENLVSPKKCNEENLRSGEEKEETSFNKNDGGKKIADAMNLQKIKVEEKEEGGNWVVRTVGVRRRVARKYKCCACHDKFNSVRERNAHMKKQHGLSGYECAECGKKFETENALARHTKGHNIKKDNLLICHHCSEVFTHESHLRRHAKVHSEERNYRCLLDVCRTKKAYKQGFKEFSDYKRHMTTHSGKVVKCDECNYEGKNKHQLSDHRRKHHRTERNCKNNIKGCMFKTKDKKALAVHEVECEEW